jgi:hypothetical protein
VLMITVHPSIHLLKVGHDPNQQILCLIQCRVVYIHSTNFLLAISSINILVSAGRWMYHVFELKKIGLACVCIPVDKTVLCYHCCNLSQANETQPYVTVDSPCLWNVSGWQKDVHLLNFSKYVLWNKEMPPKAFTNKSFVYSAV